MIEKKQTRDFGIDLFRMVCMLMVVCLHYLGHGGLTEGALTLDMPNWFTGHIVGCVCMVSVNGFVLISGYFLCTSKFRLSKWISSYIQTLCYSVGIYLAFAAIGAVPLSWERLAEAAMVLTRKQYWFITAYLLLLAISPFLNMAMDAMSQKIHLLCCSVLVGIFSLLHTIVFSSDFSNISDGKSLLWFCVLYVIAAYIRKYVPKEKVKTSKMLVIYLCGVLLMFGERLLMYWLTPKLYGQVVLPGIFNRNNSIVCLAATVAIFLVFRNLRIQNRFLQKIIMIAAPLSFAVYLIHDNNTMRYALWAMLKPFSMAHSPWMLLHLILCVSGIFAVCCAVEWLRQLLFRKLKIDKGIEKASQRITARTQKLLDKSIHTAQTDT